jgi:hypothetical protein
MKTFVIFDRKTGEILQTHVQTDDYHEGTEHLLKTVRPEAPSDAVDVVAVQDMVPGASYRVDVKSKGLVPAEASEVQGTSGAFVLPAGGDPHAARTVVLHIPQDKKD